MKKTLVLLFPGQGSQFSGMGRDLYESHRVFREWMSKLDETACAVTGESIIEKIYAHEGGKRNVFDRLLYSHSAIFMVEYALSQALLEEDLYPEYVLGTSMGEFAAAAFTGVAAAEDLLAMLIRQAQLIEEKCEPGGMIAVLADADLYDKMPFLHQNSELASVNAHSHFVVSCAGGKIQDISAFLRQQKIIHQILPVRFAFHSTNLDPVAPFYKQYLRGKTFQPPRLSYISGLHGKQIFDVDEHYFWDAVRKPIQFQRALQQLKGRKCLYLDVGPGGTLANFTRRNLSDQSAECFAIITQAHNDGKNLMRAKEILAV